MGGQHGAPDLGDELATQILAFAFECGLQLAQSRFPCLMVAAPVGVVECGASRADCALHIASSAVGGAAEDLFGRGVHVVELTSGLGLDELAVDQHAVFRHIGSLLRGLH
jgi:hypothetical protein